jgi:hypothetical protein
MEELLSENKIPCGCGCGTLIEPFDKWHHRPRQYANRHSNRGKKFISPDRFNILCTACGEKAPLNTRGNPVFYHSKNGLICRNCWDKQKYWKDPEKHKARSKECRLRFHDKRIAYDRKYKTEHKQEVNQKRLDYYYENRQSQIDKRKEHRRIHGSSCKRRRKELIGILGGKCSVCGYEKNIRALVLDHIEGKGTIDRKKHSSLLAYYRFYVNNLDIAKQTLQVLCYNCSAIKQDLKQEYWMEGRFPSDGVTTTR